MRNPLAARYDEHPWDRDVFTALVVVGMALVAFGDGATYRGWFAGAAFAAALAFVVIYSGRAWRTTYAGRATMLAMCVTVLWTGHATLILFWRYDGWESTQALIYLGAAVAALYKLRALTRRPSSRGAPDPTTDKT